MRANSLTAGLSVIALALGSISTGACKRSNKNATPVAQIQTQTPPQTVNQPVTVTGCLRAGDAGDTFVLTASETKDGAAPATYLLASTDGVNLRDNVGKRVEVSGILRTEQQVSTTSPSVPPRNKPTGTSGTPEVQTQTQLDMRRLDVSTLNHVMERCDKK
jgi:hypothetical protein